MVEVETASATKRTGRSAATVLIALLVLFGVAVGGFWYAWERLVGYERSVAYHVPAGAQFAVRADLEQVVLYEPVRRHVFPVLRRQLAESEGFQELEQETGISLGMDLREIMFVQPAEPDHWLIVIGGLFPEQGVVAGLARLLERRDIAGCGLQGPRMRCGLSRVFAEQAEDGVLVLASSEAVLESALTRSQAFEQLGLGLEDAAGFAMEGQRLRALGDLADLPVLGSLVGDLRALQSFKGAHGRVVLGEPTLVQATLVPTSGGDLSSLVPAVESMLSGASRLLALAGHADVAGERTLLASATVRTTENGAIEIESPWSRQDIDRAASSIADGLSRWQQAFEKPARNQ